MKSERLGVFEELVLLAITALGEDAYGANLQRTLERHTRRSISLGAVHAVLERLEAKEFVSSAMSAPAGGRGGRRRRVFAATVAGVAALREAEAPRRRLIAQREAQSS